MRERLSAQPDGSDPLNHGDGKPAIENRHAPGLPAACQAL
jgi:hypothetical protein